MKIEEVNMLSTAMVAIATFIGIGGATAYYLKQQIPTISGTEMVLIEVIYFLITAFLLYWIKNITKNGKEKGI